LELQTGAFRYGLGSEHTYDFVEGGLDYPMEPGIANLVSSGDTFHAYFDPTSGHSMLSALDDLDTLIAEADPPYDAVLGFSHGSCLAATMLLRSSRNIESSFKLAVFFSAGMAADHAALHQDKVQMLQQNPGGRLIDIPTAHVYAENDEVAPSQGKLLFGLCSEKERYMAVHRLGHRVPGTAERGDLENAVAVIRRAIEDAKKRVGG